MKKRFLFLLFMFGIFIAISAFADEPNLPSEKDSPESSLNEDSSKNVKIDPITGFPMITVLLLDL